MRTTSVTRLRTETTKLVQEIRDLDEPVLVLQNSSIAAYLVGPKLWNGLATEIKRLRKRTREQFWEGVREAEREAARGETTAYANADDLIAALGLETEPAAIDAT